MESGETKPNIIIVDDHLIFRQGLISILTVGNIANVIGEASNGLELLELLSHHKPDLILMDIDMPHMNGIDATEKALALIPDLKIIAFTMFSDEEYYYKMIDKGVKGFILKTSGINELEIAVRQVILGESYFSNELLRQIISNFSRKSEPKQTIKNYILSEREIEVLKNICIGLNTDEIAQKLFISPKTVKTHRANLLEKTLSKNTPELIYFALKNKIVEI
jgi:DNA-binding NarL/FixJ family response regulator